MTPLSIRQSLAQRSSLVPLVLVCIMAALLVLVGSLQYRWAKEETAATEIRIGTNIESVMVDWHGDFYRQFSDLCVALQVGPDSGAFDDWDAYRSRFIRWKVESRYPTLVRHLYIWETSAAGPPRLLALKEDKLVPEQVIAAPPLLPLLRRLRTRSADLRTGLQAWQFSNSSAAMREIPSPYSTLSGWQFDPNLPALVHPIVHHSLPGDAESRVDPRAVDWMVVLLDLPTIRERILPTLTQRYFEHGLYGPLDVTVAASGSAPHILYASNPDLAMPDNRNPDAVLNIFGLAPETTEGHLWEAVKNTNSVKPQEWHSFQAPVWFPVIRYTPHGNDWTLTLRSRAGRLDSVVLRVRRENMFVNLSVLILLAVNMSLIGISYYRSSRFAQLQMDFVASISHELRTPLAALLSAGENIRDGVVEQGEQLRRYGGIITTQAQQLIGLLDQILAYASTRSGNRKYRKANFSINAVVESILRSNDSFLQGRGFTIEKRIPPDLPLAMGDSEAVAQCLQNLLTNAVKYSGSCRRISISAAQGTERSSPFVAITVKDFGIGIAAAELPMIFRPFYRASSVQEAQIHGTGLGLAVAKKIAEDLGGTLSVESRLGAGSKFTLRVPAAGASRFTLAAPQQRPEL